MKKRVLIDVKVTCDPPTSIGRWARSLERKAEELQQWCDDFEAFVRDHRSQDPVSLSVEREYQEQCSFCKCEWETDEDGPLCCNAAQKEWDEQKSIQATG